MKNMLYPTNIGLLFRKTNNIDTFTQVFITNFIVERGCLSGGTGGIYIAPLYLYEEDESIVMDFKKETNFTQKFKSFVKEKPYANATPEEILAYIYAVLYHPAYRERYLEYLKIDFPKIPFSNDINTFNRMIDLGKELINLHLMKNIPDYQEIRINANTDDYLKAVEKLNSKQRYKDNKIYINQTLFIEGVDKKVWEYKIGSYQVIDKWLKYRIGKELEFEDLEHLEKMIKIIKKTIEIQEKLKGINLEKLF
jgi:predicted helicase